MPHHIPWHVRVTDHPGSSREEIEAEPDWGKGHEHHIGYKNFQDRLPGLTHASDEHYEELEEEIRSSRS
jgi:nitrate reductase (NAD(P)H)